MAAALSWRQPLPWLLPCLRLCLHAPLPLLPTSAPAGSRSLSTERHQGRREHHPQGCAAAACMPAALPAACLLPASRTTTQPSSSPALGGRHSGTACLPSSLGRHNPALACLRAVCPDPLCCRPGALHCQRELRGRHGGPHLLRCCWACCAVPAQLAPPPPQWARAARFQGLPGLHKLLTHPDPTSPFPLQAT